MAFELGIETLVDSETVLEGIVGKRMGATDAIAQFIHDTSYEGLPEAVVKAAKIAILDGVANVLAGSTQPVATVVVGYVRDMGGTAQSSVVGHGFRTNPLFAAFANGVFLHCLDYEIQGVPPAHGTSVILSTALALGETVEATGKGVITAYTIGWEVQQRLRKAGVRANLRGLHPPGVYGPMGAAAAGATIMGLDLQQTRVALGIAASRTGGLFANNGTMVKSTHPGNAARLGVEAVLLAKARFTANESILEARQGYVEALFGDVFDWDVLTDGLGQTYQLVDPGFNIKRYPAEIYMQWAIDAVRDLRDRYNLSPQDVEWLELEVPHLHVEVSRPRPKSGLDGKFSFEYCAAVGLVEDRVGIDSFSDETRFSPAVEEALGKVRLRENPDIPREPTGIWITATARTRDGRELSERCRSYHGSIANRMNREERLEKYEDCVKRVLDPAEQDRVLAIVEYLEQLGDVRELTEILIQEPSAKIR